MQTVKLRPYQEEAVASSIEITARGERALVGLPTGMGKTEIMKEFALRLSGSGVGLLLAHRDELCAQAASRLESAGFTVFIEKAESEPGMLSIQMAVAAGPTIVVGSVQTMKGRRLRRWESNFFAYAMIDEAHHSLARTYRAIIDHFPTRWVGVTATGMREGLGDIWEMALSSPRDPSRMYSLKDGIDQGYLVPPKIRVVVLDEWDMSQFRKPRKGADLKPEELARMLDSSGAMKAALEPILQEIGSHQTIIFWPGVTASRVAAEWLRVEGRCLKCFTLESEETSCAEGAHHFKTVSASSVDGGTPRDVRLLAVKRYKNGTLQIFCNCEVLTEGFDAPGCSCIVLASPTTQPNVYLQKIGRGARPAADIADLLSELETPEERRAAIASSSKPFFLLLDFEGSGENFDLVSPIDLLCDDGDGVSPAVKKKARDDLKKGGEDPRTLEEILADAKEAMDRIAQDILRREKDKAGRRRAALAEKERRFRIRGANFLGEKSEPDAVPLRRGRATPARSAGLNLHDDHAGRHAKRASVAGRAKISEGQKKFLYSLHRQIFGPEFASIAWRRTAEWSTRGASDEITYLRRRYSDRLQVRG